MAWVRIDDQVLNHPKMLKAGAEACWLWVCALAYSQAQLTDGLVPNSALTRIGFGGSRHSTWLAHKLVAAGLFERVPEGYRIHDYLKYNESRANILPNREALLDARRAAGRLGGLAKASKQPSKRPSKSLANGSSTCLAPSHPIVQNVQKTVRSVPSAPPDPDVKTFLEWFQTQYREKRHGAEYLVDWAKDGRLVQVMLKATRLPRLQQFAQIMLSDKCEDEFIVESDRGIGVLKVKFNWLSERLAAWEARQR